MSKKLSSYFARQATERDPLLTPGAESSQPAVRLDRTRTFSSSRPSRANGSAYGYAGSYRSRLASSVVNNRRGSNASTMRRRHMSLADSQQRDSMASSTDLNFAQRLLIANENAVTNIADLWVAAAMNVDNEDVFEDSDTELGENDEEEEAEDRPSRSVLVSPIGGRPSTSRRLSAGRRPSAGPVGRFESPRRPSTVRRPSFSQTLEGARRLSAVPSIFAHPGVKTPPAVLDAQMLLSRDPEPPSAGPDLLEPIIESRRVSLHDAEGQIEVIEPQPSMMSQLPVLVIIQYGMLALHTTTHDQIFLSYLVSDVNAGGLNLEASHFAQLIALMCLAQIAYQFYLYPNIGPPRGRFSHLAMFRIGSVLFIPAYLAVILLHPFATDSEGENFSVMSGLAVITAVRYSGGTFCYTSISILLNYMTPPPAIGLANGMAQSIVSLARCFGPVLGGYLWSVSVQDNPSGYPLGFVICGAACLFSVLHSFMIR
ncbi:unnamed protein product [Mycena citricolor]|uniref:Uncharacterized protein n=1 Tax=Mycena citricolor TaxID=2018698 RepID=A0AAD2GSJ9_9AGAR|nr:unnamed protein product [Mycena citricolor]